MRHFYAVAVVATLLLPTAAEARPHHNERGVTAKETTAVGRSKIKKKVGKRKGPVRDHLYHGDFWPLVPGLMILPLLLRG